MKHRRSLIRLAIAAGIAIAPAAARNDVIASSPASIVYSSADSGPGSLREAIATAPPGGIITFSGVRDPGSSTVITLTSGPLAITKDLTIDGSAWPGLTISGNDASRVVSITAPVSVTLNALTITRGNVDGFCDLMLPGGGAGGGIHAVGGQLTIVNSAIVGNQVFCEIGAGLVVGNGGGVYSDGVLIVRNSVFRENAVSQWADGAGAVMARQRLVLVNVDVRDNTGGSAIIAGVETMIERSTIVSNSYLGISAGPVDFSVANLSIKNSAIMSNTRGGIVSSGALLTVTNSLVSGNGGGAIYNSGQLSLVNSTISGNGGAIQQDGFSSLPSPRAVIASSAIVSNIADYLANSGINAETGVIEVANSIVAGNAITNNFNIAPRATIMSLGYNMTNSTDVLTATGDQTGTLPWLGQLQDNGGPTPTHALLEGSPGIDAGNPAGCTDAAGTLLTQDQRGYPRSADGSASEVRRCDIGAYERWLPVTSLYMPFLPTVK